ncbi:hypothetical protein AUQ37_03455 [Candidatus Methanomethylophilus sp. 1R26]|nr:hypothetical protein AUQ37_03455 [Candidatus Methanomethylophilus sp. 1R26]
MSVFKNATIAMADVLGSRNYIKNAGKDPKTDAERHYAEMLHNLMADAVSLFEDSEDISLKAFSDNFIIYSEDNSPNTAKRIVQGMAGLQYNAICKYGLLLRGGITEGKMYWSEDGAYDDFVTGKALLRAHELESEIAVYPRIIVDGPVADKIDAGGLVVRNENIFFINYLTYTKLQETSDSPAPYAEDSPYENGGMIADHASALKKHVSEDLGLNIKGHEWDSIRDKDVWALAYHNYFCGRHSADAYRIDFSETYDDTDRIVIRIEDGNSDGGRVQRRRFPGG